MERIVIPKTTAEQEAFFTKLMDRAVEIIDLTGVVSVAPTTSGGELKQGQIAFYSGNLYINFNGTTYKITLTSV